MTINIDKRRQDGSETVSVEHALDYASRYFQSHAEQRLKTLRYFLGYLLVLSAGLYKILLDCHYGILFFSSLISLIITLFFWVLELRNKQLVDIGNSACQELEEELIKRLQKKDRSKFKKINIVQTAENELKWFSYRKAIFWLFLVISILQFIMLIVSFFSWIDIEFKLHALDLIEYLKEGCPNKK